MNVFAAVGMEADVVDLENDFKMNWIWTSSRLGAYRNSKQCAESERLAKFTNEAALPAIPVRLPVRLVR